MLKFSKIDGANEGYTSIGFDNAGAKSIKGKPYEITIIKLTIQINLLKTLLGYNEDEFSANIIILR